MIKQSLANKDCATKKQQHGVRAMWSLACLLALIPLVSVHLAYAVSIAQGTAPACVPYWQGCTSISAAVRNGWANHLFKLSMLPYTSLLFGYWWLCAAWSRQLVPARRRRRYAMLACGTVGAVFLALYIEFLGVEGDTYRWLRRYGINLYFSGTVLAQMLLASLLVGEPRVSNHIQRGWLILCGLLLGLGLASLPLQFVVDDRHRLLNAIEWLYALLMVTAYPLTGYAWRATGFSPRPEVR